MHVQKYVGYCNSFKRFLYFLYVFPYYFRLTAVFVDAIRKMKLNTQMKLLKVWFQYPDIVAVNILVFTMNRTSLS